MALGFVGSKFTCTNCRQNGSLIRTRIDRTHANATWLNIFPESKVMHLPRLTSDHCPILLRTNPWYTPGRKPFRFEPFWMKHKSFIPLTTIIWDNENHNLSQSIKIYQDELTKWNLKTFGNIFFEIKRTKARLYGIQKSDDYGYDPQLLLLE